MKLLKNKYFLLTLIVAFSMFLRIWDLGKVPSSLNWDEVSLGYNAYSILQTGKDEYGKFLPVVLQSYDDYKPALYSYMVIPFIMLFDLTEQAVRLPSVVSGVGAIVIVYFLVAQILKERRIRILNREVPSYIIALLTSLFLAISPWHIQFSRIAFESNVGLTINLLVFLMFLKGLKKPFLLPLAFFFGGLNLYMYQSDRVFTPLLLIALSLIYYKNLLKIKKWFLISCAVAIIVSLPLGWYIGTNDDALLRARGVSIFSSQSLVERSANKLLYDEGYDNVLGKVLDNRRVEFVKATAYGYLSHFDPVWLFISGDIARHHAPSMGHLYIFQIPLLLIGIYIMIFLPIDKKNKIAFFAYFLLVPVPASITSGVPHAVRTLNFAWTFETFIALGTVTLVVFILKKRGRVTSLLLKIVGIFYVLFAIFNFFYYYNQYFVQLNYFTASDWLYGYKQAVLYTKSVGDSYDKIVVENEAPFDQSYMFFLFYLKVDPALYQSYGGTKTGGFKERHTGFYNYTFEPVSDQKNQGKVLLVGSPGDLGEGSKKFIIKYPNSSPAIVISEK